jgi:hypothetical protein
MSYRGSSEPADFEGAVSRKDNRSGIRIIPFLLVILICLAAGLLLGTYAGGNLPPASASPQNSPTVLVLLGYDTLQNSTAVRAIWILTLDGKQNAGFLGVSPATVFVTVNGQAVVLRDYLGDPTGAPARLTQISFFPQPALTIQFDQRAIFTIINRLGGIWIDKHFLQGQETLDWLSASGPDPLEALRRQEKVMQSVFSAGPCLSESILSGLYPEHLVSTLLPETLVGECVRRGPFLKGNVQFRILDNVIPWELPDGSTGLLPQS